MGYGINDGREYVCAKSPFRFVLVCRLSCVWCGVCTRPLCEHETTCHSLGRAWLESAKHRHSTWWNGFVLCAVGCGIPFDSVENVREHHTTPILKILKTTWMDKHEKSEREIGIFEWKTRMINKHVDNLEENKKKKRNGEYSFSFIVIDANKYFPNQSSRHQCSLFSAAAPINSTYIHMCAFCLEVEAFGFSFRVLLCVFSVFFSFCLLVFGIFHCIRFGIIQISWDMCCFGPDHSMPCVKRRP